MAREDARQPISVGPRRPVQDLPGCIKYILLFFLILLLLGEIAAGEFRRIAEAGWLTWVILLIKLILIGGLIALIKVQRDLKCDITAPTGCTEEEPDPVAGILFVRVIGTASGAVFGSYTLEIQKDGDPPIAGVVSYPGGGSSGSAPVIGGELGRINTTSLSDGAYTITLRVYPAGPGSPKVCTTTFNLLKVIVYMNRVAGVQAIVLPDNANPFDPIAELRTDYAVAPPPHDFRTRSLGGSMTIKGAAYIYECAARKIKKYEIRYAHVSLPGTEPPQPNKGDPIPVTWPVAQRIVLFEYAIPDQYQPWTRVGPAPTDLINSWNTMTIGGTTYYKLNPGSWNSAVAASGRYSLLLTAEDTTVVTYHDIQHVWLDNKSIIGKIVKFQRLVAGVWTDIPPCVDLLFSFGTIRIVGLAWDPVIDEAWWPPATPNDNYGYYRLDFWKQFGPPVGLTSNISTRVPALPALPPVPTPTDADAGELAQW
ncbi:MAG: hypothetical protein ACREJ4_06975, partial [Candidatus Methylomirabilaceae bacterium]